MQMGLDKNKCTDSRTSKVRLCLEARLTTAPSNQNLSLSKPNGKILVFFLKFDDFAFGM